MEDSERLYNERRKLELDLLDVQTRRKGLAEDLEIRDLAIDLLIERTVGFNDSRVIELSAKIESKKKALSDEEHEIKIRLKENHSALEALTRPIIEKCVHRLRSEISELRMDRKVLGRTRGGISMENRLEILSNEDGIFRVNKLVKDGIETLGRMETQPTFEIESFLQATLEEVRKIDLGVCKKIIDEAENERFEFLNAAK